MKPITKTKPFSTLSFFCNVSWLYALSILASGDLLAQTIISGPTISGGTWSPSGNPFIITGNSSVGSGQILTIEPGVIVWIGSNVTLTVNGGGIQAVGTPSQRITIQSASSSYYFNQILMENESGYTNRFKYCDFANAQAAIVIEVLGGNQVTPLEIMNCTFSNCVQEAIYGTAQGMGGGFGSVSATLNPVIKNCVFNATSNGCVLYTAGSANAYTGYGYSYPTIVANIFQNLTGTAFVMQAGSYTGGATAVFQNNTMVNCGGGINATDPWNATVQGNIFEGVTNAVTDTATLTRTVSYNAFYENPTNFTGYSPIYGQVVLNNRNGTPCDLLFNIFQNPLFASATNFFLATNSPCVNAGPLGQAFENMCFPPSIGTNFNDMGAYGGPDSCNWLDVVPLVQVQPSISRSNKVFWLNWYPVPRSTYQIQYATNVVNGSNYWRNLTNGQTEALGTPWSLSVAPYPPTNKMQFYRIQSLGRTPGN